MNDRHNGTALATCILKSTERTITTCYITIY